MPITHLDYLPLAEENEGNIPWMYLDTRGNVTVGIGHLLDDADEAAKLPFVAGRAGRPAAAADIVAGHAAVRRARRLATRGAGAFRGLTDLRLPEASVLALYERDFNAILGYTRDAFRSVGGGFDSYPPAAQLAVLDMAFNLGARGLYRRFPRFREHGLGRRDFATAARECRRTGISASRNDRTRDLLLEAARAEADAGLSPSAPAMLG